MNPPETRRRRTRARWPEIALLGASLLCSACLAELYLRLFNPIDSLLLETDPRYLFRLIPGGQRLFYREGEDGTGRILVRVNSGGFRGRELRQPKRTARVVVYGDSFVMAALTALDDTFPIQLARKLERATHARVEAVNAGVMGYGPDQECLRIEDEIGPLAPDLLVVAIFAGNDFGDLVRDKIFRLASDGTLRPNHYRLSHSAIANFPDQPGSAPWSMLWRGVTYLVQPSLLSPHVREPSPRPSKLEIRGYVRKAREEYEDFVVRGDDEVQNLFGDTYDADVSLAPDRPSARYSKAVMEQVLIRIEGVARAHRVPTLLVFIPSVADVGDGPRWSAWSRAARAVSSDYRPDALTDALSDIARRHAFEYVDLFQPFRDAGASGLYFPADGHWNAAGQALAAELAMKRIVTHGLLRRLVSAGIPGRAPAHADDATHVPIESTMWGKGAPAHDREEIALRSKAAAKRTRLSG
jgi:hypothetical protein